MKTNEVPSGIPDGFSTGPRAATREIPPAILPTVVGSVAVMRLAQREPDAVGPRIAILASCVNQLAHLWRFYHHRSALAALEALCASDHGLTPGRLADPATGMPRGHRGGGRATGERSSGDRRMTRPKKPPKLTTPPNRLLTHDDPGIPCPGCGSTTDHYIYRTTLARGKKTRLRICRACGRSFKTDEQLRVLDDNQPAPAGGPGRAERRRLLDRGWTPKPPRPRGLLLHSRSTREE